ncbi:MAG: LemA family protein [Eubacterium sp.]|nr:LemA family protein [Eubacterium sp.]
MIKYIIIAVVVVVLLAIILGFISAYNTLVKLRNSVEEAFATMDVYLKKRWDLIPNIVASVKGYAKHEAETLQNVITARNARYQDLSVDEKLEANKELSRGLASINVVAEQYPQLRANENFMNLNNQLQRTEDDIANARKYYNAVVKSYNNKIQMFPSNIVASMFNFKRQTMFAVESSEERENVKVEF